ncbi:benzoylformate decarboxylase [Psychrobacter sp. H7-1]|uniref:benzoylformate decarboxylase n=1 Tax=Psychrobacter sp. H7-1 TaxID=1569265 RepID=UPI00191B562D|nr:benzoylformate decarboxylase [Psychrobacter sp. H7-1]
MQHDSITPLSTKTSMLDTTAESVVSQTVQQVVFELMRTLNMTTVFGNPGSTELNFLTNFPEDFSYVLGLHEASVVGMADGYAQATGNAAFVNLHSAAGVGNALGNIFTAYRNHTPLVITAGQQARSLLPFAPYLGAEQAAQFPQPYIKWSIEPARAEDVPLAIAQAYLIAMQHPQGPTFVSIPSDDWDKPAVLPLLSQSCGHSIPSPDALAELVEVMSTSQNMALVVGSDVDRQGGFELAVAVAEACQAPVWEAPNSSRASFPENHPLFAGFLPAIPEKLSEKLLGYDTIVVIGAPAFTLHVAGTLSLKKSKIYQLTDDPQYAAQSLATKTLSGNIRDSLQALLDKLPTSMTPRSGLDLPVRKPAAEVQGSNPISIEYVMATLAKYCPEDVVIVEEAPSHRPAIQRYLPITQPKSFYTMASGGLGYGLPAAVGVALGTQRRTLCLIGDGSSMYSIQAIWTAVQHNLPVTVIVLNNTGYGAMRSFSKIMGSTQVPGLDLPNINFVQLAQSMGCQAQKVTDYSVLDKVFADTMQAAGSYLLEIMVDANTGAVY